MIATSLMYSISRYIINFIDIFFDIKRVLEKKYYKLIGNNKFKEYIKDFHTCMFKADDDINCLNLKNIVNANVIKITAQVINKLNLS